MMRWLQSEVAELQDEMDLLCKQNDKNESQATDALISELGDILFDCLMLEASIRRDYGLGINSAWDAASSKVERRTPYMTQWGDGKSIATTVEDAERIWQDVKQQEKLEKKYEWSK